MHKIYYMCKCTCACVWRVQRACDACMRCMAATCVVYTHAVVMHADAMHARLAHYVVNDACAHTCYCVNNAPVCAMTQHM